jgi:Domain of unknown function (DUF4150)
VWRGGFRGREGLMGNVYANGLEISGKAVNARTLAVFPDTCMTPPENPATPPGVPVPYPSFGFASETDKGTGTVKVRGETVNIKNLSFLSKTTGTEAGSAAKKGVISSNNTGKAYFVSWSGNVKFDGEPVVRNTDLSTHNHASPGPNTGPKNHQAGSGSGDDECDALANQIEDGLARNKHAHKGSGTHGYLFRMAEQRCGEHGPGTEGWTGHETALKETYKSVKENVDTFMANCDPDDYNFNDERRDGGRDVRIKGVMDKIHEDDEALQPSSITHLGRKHPLCVNLDAVRGDRTLAQVFNLLGL